MLRGSGPCSVLDTEENLSQSAGRCVPSLLVAAPPVCGNKVWRRANKKSRGETVAKRRTRKTGRVQKAIVGISLEEIKRTRLTKPDPSKVSTS